MKVEDVMARVEQIKAVADSDDESAHWEEDALHRDVLAAIADGTAVDGATMARIALTTRELDFSRWYA